MLPKSTLVGHCVTPFACTIPKSRVWRIVLVVALTYPVPLFDQGPGGWMFSAAFGQSEATPDEASPPQSTEVAHVDFARDIQPIFAAHCADCHGAGLQENNYRLDVREVAWKGGDSGLIAVVPGKPQDSRLMHVIEGTDEDGVTMPPDGSEPLSDQQRQTVRRWIEQGAVWPDELAGSADEAPTTDHWAFQPIRALDPPDHGSPWVMNGVDAFVLERLRAEGLEPSEEATRSVLIRRLYLDLLGLPPTPEEVEAFVQDERPDAYQRVVQHVLGSPHYGERWARHWLDVIRFGESHGFETNPERPNAYHFRDYVIDALNRDKPYDQFVREQIAGDSLGADVATGFLVAGAYDQVKSPDINLTLMQRQDELADIINTTGTAFLGLTVGCARCHNHKFDPILQSDYYSMQAVFAGVQHGERAMNVPVSEEAQQRLTEQRARIAELSQQIEKLRTVAAQVSQGATETLREPVNSQKNVEQFDPVPARFVRFVILQTAGGGEPCIDELEVIAEEPGPDGQPVNVALASLGAKVTASGTLPGYPIHQLEHLNDGKYGNSHSWIADTSDTGWVEVELPAEVRISQVIWGRDRQQQFRDRVAANYRVEVAVERDQWQLVASAADRQPYGGDSSDAYAFLERLPPEQKAAAEAVRDELKAAQSELSRWEAATLPTAYIGTFRDPEPTYRLYRGDPMAKREQVPPDAIRVMGSLDLPMDTPERERRLALAQWVTSPTNPLTARVIVNRVWYYHFGTGIVPTPSDFGAAGVPPSHPELLDWLAHGLIENDWSLKWLHRTILMSRTYRQSSAPREDGLAKDASARLLWRFPPRRLEAEAIRDCILAASGSLNLQAGGPGFNPFDVKKETVHHYFPKTNWGPNEWRRMIYMTKIRQEQDAVFGVFDCPDGGQVIPVRSRSTTPLQALNLLNSSFLLQQSEILAERLKREAGQETAAQVQTAFRLMFHRAPADEELELATALIRDHGLDAFCRAMLNANEFLFLY
jgi:mono/diheme cytochrome c family protein